MFPAATVFLGCLASLCLASPVNRTSRSAASQYEQQAQFLSTQASEVATLTSVLHRDYRNSRFTEATTVGAADVTPQLNLPAAVVSTGHSSDSEYVNYHYGNLQNYNHVLGAVRVTEDGQFGEKIDGLISKLDLLIQRIDEVRQSQNWTAQDYQPSNLEEFNDDSTLERNKRTLLVLQEFKAYMLRVENCFNLLYQHSQQ